MRYIFQDAELGWHLEDYAEYLDRIRPSLPSEVGDFICDIDRNGLTGRQTLHDSWVNELRIEEDRDKRSPERTTTIHLTLLGGWHDRLFEFTYRNVQSYELSMPQGQEWHSDMLVHEFRIEDDGLYCHEFVFADGAKFVIHCTDVIFTETFGDDLSPPFNPKYYP